MLYVFTFYVYANGPLYKFKFEDVEDTNLS